VTSGPRSGVYILTLYRQPSVAAVYVDVTLRDANGVELIPSTKLWVGDKTGPVRRKGYRRSRRHLRQIAEDVGRRKGKGGASGRAATRTASGSSYGYSSRTGVGAGRLGYGSRTASSRYVGGVRTLRPYGYTGRGMMAGVAFFMIWRGGSHGGYYGYCDRYGASSRERCRSRYQCSFTDASNTTERCTGTTQGDVTRDDILVSGFRVRDAVFPLTLTISKVATVLHAGVAQPEEWDTPLWYSFSEVEVGPEEEAESLIGLYIFLGILGGCCFCLCGYIMYYTCARRNDERMSEHESRRHQSSSVYGSRRVSRNSNAQRNSNASSGRPSARSPSPPPVIAEPPPPAYSKEAPPVVAIPMMAQGQKYCNECNGEGVVNSAQCNACHGTGTPPAVLAHGNAPAIVGDAVTKHPNGQAYFTPIPAAAQVHPELPPNWQCISELDPNTNVATGRVYYYNHWTGETTWELPAQAWKEP